MGGIHVDLYPATSDKHSMTFTISFLTSNRIFQKAESVSTEVESSILVKFMVWF